MFLFKEKHVAMINDGSKTETRRLWKPDYARNIIASKKNGTIHKCKLLMMNPNFFAKIKLREVYPQAMCEMYTVNCTREGYPHMKPLQFWAMFCILHKIDVTDPDALEIWKFGTYKDRVLYVVEFEKSEE